MDGRQALLLVAHGSQLNAEAALPALRHAESILARNLFDEVATAFWKEEPTLGDALLQVQAEEVFVVPLFLAEGYFTRTVVPREMGPKAAAHGRRIRYCRAVGSHPDMCSIAELRAIECLDEAGVAPRDAVVVIAAHGTDLSAESAKTGLAVARELEAGGRFAGVAVGFLDQTPSLREVVDRQRDGHVAVVPYFLAEGLHTRRTIPEALRLEGRHTARDGRVLHYGDPVGTSPRVAEIAVSLAIDAGARGHRGRSAEDGGAPGTATEKAPRLAEWIRDGGAPRTFLQVGIRGEGASGFRLTHREDGIAPAPAAHPGPNRHESGRRTSAASHRPLRAAPDLPGGWVVREPDAAGVVRTLATLYPTDVARWEPWRDGRLALVPWHETAARQSGRYGGVGALEGRALARATRACCASVVCLRTPLWSRRRAVLAPSTPRADRVPCPEACPIFVSLARAALEIEASLQPVTMEEGARHTALRALRLVAAQIAREGSVATADFTHLSNPRRLRLLAELLAPRPPIVPRGDEGAPWRLCLDVLGSVLPGSRTDPSTATAPAESAQSELRALAHGISVALQAIAVARQVGCRGGVVRVGVRPRRSSVPRVSVAVGVVESADLGELRRRLRADRALRPGRRDTPPAFLTVRADGIGDGGRDTRIHPFEHGVHEAS